MNAPTKPETLEFAREELSGKLLALCVGQMEKLKTPWNMTSEKNQEIALNKMREVIDGAVRNAVLVIATERRPALRATDPKALYRHPDPVGPENDSEILKAALGAEMVIFAWGEHGWMNDRGPTVWTMLRNAGVVPHTLKLTKSGQPCHPLYLPYSLHPVPMP